MTDTIASIATAPGESGVAVIRVTGARSVAVVERVFRGRKALSRVSSHRVVHGTAIDRDGRLLDDVLVTVMKGPRSYTGEDVVEVSTHGGAICVSSVLAAILEAGARLAKPGEFTERAFLAGKMDLTQAESVMELVHAQSLQASRAALAQLGGSLSAEVRGLRERLVQMLASVEMALDYPEHEEEGVTRSEVEAGCRALLQQVDHLLNEGRAARLLRSGVKTVLLGAPNAGKSSLLNAMLRRERAIVSDVPGTTRDVIEERMHLGGYAVLLTDTAGVREAGDVVERQGVIRTLRELELADAVIVVIDGSKPMDAGTADLLLQTRERARVVAVSKADMGAAFADQQMAGLRDGEEVVRYVVHDRESVARVAAAVQRVIEAGALDYGQSAYLLNERHLECLREAQELLTEVAEMCEQEATQDLLASSLQRAWLVLGDIIGETAREDLLDEIFSRFCLGK